MPLQRPLRHESQTTDGARTFSARSGLKAALHPLCRWLLWCVLALAMSHPLHAGVEFRVSIKVILGPNGEWPDNPNTIGATGLNLNSETVIRDNIDFANTILARHAVGYKIVLRDNQIRTLSGFDSYWYTADARSAATRDQVEEAATLNVTTKAIWKWHDDSINIYINDSRSGVCSFPSEGRGVVLSGAGAYQELILHELGHFFSLNHTHTIDRDSALDDWADGDSLAETLPDDADASAADINNRYDGDPQPFQPQHIRDDLIFNLMSYHQPQDRFVWGQREMIVAAFNGPRAYATAGRARFIQSDGNNAADGLTVANRLRTIGQAVNVSGTANDVVLIRSGTYNANSEGLPFSMTKPLTLSAWRGPVTITR